MSIFVNKDTRLVVQGITGKEGQFHTRQCVAYGTNVVAGVTPGKGGQKMDEVPVFNTVNEAVEKAGANCSMIFVPPPFTSDAIMEATDAGIPLIVGAGINSAADVKKSLELGAVGVAVATDVVKATNPRGELIDLTEGFI